MSSNTKKRRTGGSVPPPGKRSSLPFVLVGGGVLLLVVVGILALWRPASEPAGAGSQSAGASAPAQVTGKPRLAVDKEQIDFGKVKLGKMVEATFKLSNVGDQPLVLAGVPPVEVVKGC